MASVVAALEPHLRPGQCVVDTSTSSVALTREIGARLTAKGILFADAPVARAWKAAARGELSIMVGPTDETFLFGRSWKRWARMSPIADRSAAAR